MVTLDLGNLATPAANITSPAAHDLYTVTPPLPSPMNKKCKLYEVLINLIDTRTTLPLNQLTSTILLRSFTLEIT